MSLQVSCLGLVVLYLGYSSFIQCIRSLSPEFKSVKQKSLLNHAYPVRHEIDI